MTAQRNKEFQIFIESRSRLNEQLDRLRAEVDNWLAANAGDAVEGDPSLKDIAALAGLLENRKDLLSELARLDDNFITFLLQLRNTAENGP